MSLMPGRLPGSDDRLCKRVKSTITVIYQKDPPSKLTVVTPPSVTLNCVLSNEEIPALVVEANSAKIVIFPATLSKTRSIPSPAINKSSKFRIRSIVRIDSTVSSPVIVASPETSNVFDVRSPLTNHW